MKLLFLVASMLFTLQFSLVYSQSSCYFQQRVKYVMNVTLEDKTNKVLGSQNITYYNNSTIDTLDKIYFHLYWNAFHPNSMMDVQSMNILDPDSRLGSKINKFSDDEMGYQKVVYVKQGESDLTLKEHETILEVHLKKPLLPLDSIILNLYFEAQVPKIVRRGGRDNNEGIKYSMSQWYPKICEFDVDGWHLNPYIMREFYGVWGDYYVNITAPSDYIVPAGGYLTNEQETPLNLNYLTKNEKQTVTWKYESKNVHDFVWAADKNYNIIVRKVHDSLLLKFFFNNYEGQKIWKKTADKLVKVYPFIEKTFGKYPYKEYSFIQGGDGGMEYPMATLIKNSNFGTAIHEWMHSWYQMLLATNESYYAWMDEGFTTYSANRCNQFLKGDSLNTYRNYYNAYYALINSNDEEPLTTHADHFTTNRSYGIASYVKGAIFLDQLGYIVGDKVRDNILKKYYYDFRFTHPNDRDFFRVAEKVSGFNLKWYHENWIKTTKTIDYSIELMSGDDQSTTFTIIRKQQIPMPLDIVVSLKNDSQIFIHIPLYYCFATKNEKLKGVSETITKKPYSWIHPKYQLTLPIPKDDIERVAIDPSKRMADIDRSNNIILF